MQVTVYILRCADGSFYTGLTRQDARARAYEHNTDPIGHLHGASSPGRCLSSRRSMSA
jgi:predicted GIY-YIG superfamily endonuclease